MFIFVSEMYFFRKQIEEILIHIKDVTDEIESKTQ
jgi:hypothetical protein